MSGPLVEKVFFSSHLHFIDLLRRGVWNCQWKEVLKMDYLDSNEVEVIELDENDPRGS